MRNFFSKINENIYSKITAIILLVICVILISLALCLKYFISYTFVEKKIYEQTGLKIELIEPESHLDFKLNFHSKAKVLNIYNKDRTTQFISIKNPYIIYKPIGFLFNKIYFKKINIDNFNMIIQQDQNGKIDILESFNKDLFKKLNPNLKINRLNLDIKNIDIVFEDNYRIKTKTKISFNDSKINIDKRKKILSINNDGYIESTKFNQTSKSNINIGISSKYPMKHFEKEKLLLNVKIDNLDLFCLTPLFKKYISKDILAFNSKLNLQIKTKENNTGIHKLNIYLEKPNLKLNNNKVISPYKNNVNTEILFTILKNELKLDDLKINSNKLSISSYGTIKNIFSKKSPLIDLKINFKDTELNNFLYFIPDNAIFYRPQGIPNLKKSNFFGLIDGTINFKYSPLDMTGNLKIKDVHIPKIKKSYRKNDVNLIFMKDKMRVYTRVYTQENEYVLVDGVSNLDNSLYGTYSIKSTSKIDLDFASRYLVPVQQIIGFNIGPVPNMKISGTGNIDINTKGTLSDAQIFGTFEASNASANLKGLNAKLTNGKCKLTFKNRDLSFDKISGKLDNSNFTLTGIGNTKGDVKLNITIADGSTNKIFNILKTSTMLKKYKKITNQIEKINGIITTNINLTGNIPDFEQESLLDNLEGSGDITFKNNNLILDKNIVLSELSGILNFGKTQSGDFKFNLGKSKFNFEFNSQDPLEKILKNEKLILNTQIFCEKLASYDILDEIQNSELIETKYKQILSNLKNNNFYSKIFIKSSGNININKIDLKKLAHKGYIIGLNSSDTKDIKFNSGLIKLENNKIIFDKFNLNFNNGKILLDGNIDNINSIKPIGNLNIKLDNTNIENISKIIPNLKTDKLIINEGEILFKNDNIKFDKISLNYAQAPIFCNANIENIYNLKNFYMNFSTILNEKTTDNIINAYLISPIKIQGEMPINGSIKGTSNNYTIDFSAVMPKNSDIFYSGANLGDVNHKRELAGKITVSDNIAKVHSLKIIKYIANLNNKINPIISLKANGQIKQENNILKFNNFNITTNTPINVRMLNLIFKKSILKKGNFDCNISLNDNIKLPQITGKVNLYDLDIPLYNTEINNIKINISKNYIDGEILAHNKQSDVKAYIHALNKLQAPYIIKNFTILSNKLDINDILDSISFTNSKNDVAMKQNFNIKTNDIIVENGDFDFKEVKYNEIYSKNLKGKLNYKNEIIEIMQTSFDLAEGKIFANGKYNTKNTQLNLKANMEECDSNILAKNFLQLQNQIFGKINGTLALSAKNLNTPEGIKNIKSSINFTVLEGKMPKLGSLEYLLRAGNLFKNGILGLSLNNIIEVLTPYKTGEFEKISGDLSIQNAEINSLNIYSQGKNLSLYLTGNYNILNNFADIKIYGKLSQNISNALGALGNASINQFINVITQAKRNNKKDNELQEIIEKIPLIETENQPLRYFKASVLGDINKDNYIKSFNWI